MAKQKKEMKEKTIRIKQPKQTKPGRPFIKLNEELVYELGKLHCTMNEIASICKCSVDTLENNYSDIIKAGMEEGRRSLRRMQWGNAEKGNTSMLIWLGKQMLGQRDKQPDEVENTTFNVHVHEVPQ